MQYTAEHIAYCIPQCIKLRLDLQCDESEVISVVFIVVVVVVDYLTRLTKFKVQNYYLFILFYLSILCLYPSAENIYTNCTFA